jgi:glycine dehydrogenase subunit 2
MIKKARPHVTQDEGLIFERSSPGKIAYQLPPLDVPEVDLSVLGEANVRSEIEGFPEVSEVEAIRHFTRLSTHNYAIDLGMYPLGSCTMKYNPRINEVVARTEGLLWAHPYADAEFSQGSMEVAAVLEAALCEITGMDAVTLQPAAGAHGEWTGIMLIRALLESRGNPRKTILVPDSAHGTNPATAAMCGYQVANVPSNARGMVDVDALRAAVTEDVAGMMLTNPNTLGVFEEQIEEIARILHSKGALLYMDGANMNALMGGPATLAPTSCTSTCTRPSQRLTEAAVPVPDQLPSRRFSSLSFPCPAWCVCVTHGPGNSTGPNRSAACAPSTATSGFSSAPSPSSSLTAPRA